MVNSPRKIVLATKNKHKLREIQEILGEIPGINFVSLADYPQAPEVIEDQNTFEGNAQKKALEIANFTGEYAMADDSGLAVDALHGEPGVKSARYAGPGATYQQLCEKLLKNLKNIPAEKRTAHFVTVIALAKPGEIITTVEGRCDGIILEEMRGTNGFGYDPVFYYPPAGKTFAEMSAEEKNKYSHRARALNLFEEKLVLMKFKQ